jgi:hypothetical protein
MSLQDRIREIPGGEGFWKISAEETYLRLADRLKALGMPDNVIIDILDAAFHAAASEFGA